MSGTIVWSLILYAGTAASLLVVAHRLVSRLDPRVGLLLAAAPLLFTGRATFTGGVYAPIDIQYHWEPLASHRLEFGITSMQTPLLSDVAYSMIPWQKAVRAAIRGGRLPLWNPFVLAGEPLLAVQQGAALHPATWIGFLLPLAQAWTLQMSLRLLVALLSAYLFLRDLGCRELPSLIGAAAWGFSDFLIFWLGYPVNNTLGPFPLLLLGLGRLARDADRRAVAITVVALVLMVLAGHPEALLFGVSGAGIYFLFLLGWAGTGRRARALGLSLGAGAIALGLCAVVLLPLAEALPRTWERYARSSWWAHVKKSVPLAESARKLVPALLPFAYGESGHGGVDPGHGAPGPYVGSLALPLAAAGLLSRRRERWALLAIGAAGAALWVRLAGITDAVTSLPLFDVGWTDYLIFLTAFSIAALAALGAERLCEGVGASSFLLGAAVSAAGILALHSRWTPDMDRLGIPPEFRRERLWLAIAPLCVGGLAALAVRFRPRRAGLAVAVIALAFVAARVLEAGRVYPTLPSAAFFPPLPFLDAIPRGRPVRVVGVGDHLMPNVSAMYELEDVRGYESMTLKALFETFPLWSVPQPAWYNRVDSLDRPFLSFLNVRYAVVPVWHAPPASWRPLSRDAGGARIFENPRALARAFVPAWTRVAPDPAGRLEILASITDFAERGVLAAGGGSSSAWTRNGRARVAIRSYSPQAMSLDVDASEEAVVGSSIPAWPGWKAKLDRSPLPALSYNHAFLAFRVPPGRHRLELRYLPDGVALGFAVSLSTVAGILLSRLRRRSPRTPRVLDCAPSP